MIPEVEIVQHVNHVVCIVRIFFSQLVQNAHLDQCLMMEALLVADDFYSYWFICLVI